MPAAPAGAVAPAPAAGFRPPGQPSRPAAPHSRSVARALVLAAGSVVFCWTGITAITAVVAIVLAARDRSATEAGDRSKRVAALVFAVVGLLLSLLVGGLVIASLAARHR